jgi:rubrerythrin
MKLGPKTEKNLWEAFAGESQAHRKYTFFARKADEEGYPEIAQLFRNTAEGETAHALGHFLHLAMVKETPDNIKNAIDGEHYENTDMYKRMAEEAREEGHTDIAEWFERVRKAEGAHRDGYMAVLKKYYNQDYKP